MKFWKEMKTVTRMTIIICGTLLIGGLIYTGQLSVLFDFIVELLPG